MRKIATLALSAVAVAILALGAVVPHVKGENPSDARQDPRMLVGMWRTGGEHGRPEQEFAFMSIQPDGHVVIAARGHVIVGSYRAESSQGFLRTMAVSVEDSDIADIVGANVRVDLKVHTDNRFATSFRDDRPFELNKIWWRMGRTP